MLKLQREGVQEEPTSTQTNIKAPSNQTASELSTLSSRAETTPAPVQPLNASSHADKQEKVKEAHASPSEIAQEPATPFESQKDADQTHLERQLTVNTNTETLQNVSEKDQTLCSHTQTEPSVSGQSRDETRNPKAEPCPEPLREVQPGANGEKQEQSSEQQQEVTRGHAPLDEEDCSAQTGSPDQISTEEAEGPAVCTGTTLPNGLKPEFAFHCLNPRDPNQPAAYGAWWVNAGLPLFSTASSAILERLYLDYISIVPKMMLFPFPHSGCRQFLKAEQRSTDNPLGRLDHIVKYFRRDVTVQVFGYNGSGKNDYIVK